MELGRDPASRQMLIDRSEGVLEIHAPNTTKPALYCWTLKDEEMIGARIAISLLIGIGLALSPASLSGSQGATESLEESLVKSVDRTNMVQTIQTLQDLGSRDFHLESAREAAAYIFETLEGYGLDVEYQTLMIEDIEVNNVVATLGGDQTEPMYLFGAHYDSENSAVQNISMAENLTAPGADDDASGVAAMMEIARILGGAGIDQTVKFVAFGAEEYGFDGSGGAAGSAYFAESESSLGRTYAATAIFDMIGYRDEESSRAVMILNEESDPLASAASRAVREFDIDLVLETMVAPRITYSDHGSFWDEGFPSILIVEELDPAWHYPVNPYYHTSQDTLDKLSVSQMVSVTQAILGGFLLLDEEHDRTMTFGIVIMVVVSVPLLAYAIIRRRRRDVSDGKAR
jgi:Zn-dependent M28 family amino/carboxypeptidase